MILTIQHNSAPQLAIYERSEGEEHVSPHFLYGSGKRPQQHYCLFQFGGGGGAGGGGGLREKVCLGALLSLSKPFLIISRSCLGDGLGSLAMAHSSSTYFSLTNSTILTLSTDTTIAEISGISSPIESLSPSGSHWASMILKCPCSGRLGHSLGQP